MIGRKDPVSAGRVYEFRCQAAGARPPPIITWWRGSTQLRENVTNRVRESVFAESLRQNNFLLMYRTFLLSFPSFASNYHLSLPFSGRP